MDARGRWSEETNGFSWLLSDLERGSLIDQLRLLVEIWFSIVMWVGRCILFLVPSPFSSLLSKPSDKLNLGQSVSFSVKSASSDSIVVQSMPQGAGPIGRALFQVLALVNDIPTSSSKYEFTRALADRILEENQRQGGYLLDVNRAALSAGFQRSLHLLSRSLTGIQMQRSDGWGWPWSWLPLLNASPSKLLYLPLPHPVPLIIARSLGVCHQLLLIARGISTGGRPSDLALENNEFAEKLARELLWLLERMTDCSAAYDAVAQWSSATSLAMLSLTATPRVKRCLVKLSMLLCRGLLSGEIDIPKDAKVNILLLWLPLFCTATHGGDGSIFSSREKAINQEILQQLINTLPEVEQEEVLSLWLHEFALSPSDWPNLMRSYDNWCFTSRKLGLPGNPCRQITFDTKTLAIVKCSPPRSSTWDTP